MKALNPQDLGVWTAAKRGWRAEVLNGEADWPEFVVTAVDADLAEPMTVRHAGDRPHLFLHLNLTGATELVCGGVSQRALARTVTAFCAPESESVVCHHEQGEQRFITLRFCTDYLRGLLASGREEMRAGLDKAIASERLESERPFALNEPMQAVDRGIAESFMKPPIAGLASHLWFRAKAIELLSTWCFREEDGAGNDGSFFCSQQKRTVLERVDRAKVYLAEHLDQPLELAAVAKAAGSSPHYLSRQFSAETGLTLSRYLRALRVERASQLLASGSANVTEAATEVGYQSLSHFARAFQQEKGMTPSDFVAGV